MFWNSKKPAKLTPCMLYYAPDMKTIKSKWMWMVGYGGMTLPPEPWQ
jgi:hypothetical protein